MIHLLLSLVLWPAENPIPGADLTIPDRSIKVYVQDLGDPNKGAVSGYSLFNGEIPLGTKWLSGLPKGDKGWHDGVLPIVEGLPKLDKENSLGVPVYDYQQGSFVPFYARMWSRNPYGAYRDLVWPWKQGSALTVRTNRSKLYVSSTGSPTQALYVIGDYNEIWVQVETGTQSRHIQDLAAVRVKGKGNRISGSVKSDMCALFIDGPDSHVIDASLWGGSVGDDIGVLYFRRSSDGARVTNVSVRVLPRQYPWSHMVSGIYIDDLNSRFRLYNVSVWGAQYGIFSHGGSDNAIARYRSVGNETGYKFAKHFTTDTEPTGNSVSEYTEIQ